MGQVNTPAPPQSIILTSVDRLIASNSNGGLSPLAAHIILFGENAGHNLGDVDNVIALGAFALDAGTSDVTFDGTIAIGVNAATSVTQASTSSPGEEGPIFIGKNAAAAALRADTAVIIGGHALETATGAGAFPISQTVIIGPYAASVANGQSLTDTVIIGYRAAGYTNPGTLVNSTIIGANAAGHVSGTYSGNVVIGAGAGDISNGATDNVFIGQNCAGATGGACAQNVIIGQSAGVSTGSQNVVIGHAANAAAGTLHVLLGDGNQMFGARNILIGQHALINTGINQFTDDHFIVGTANNAHIVGNMATGSMVVGNSDATNNDLPGTNIVKLINGTVTGVAPVGGGFLYSLAGQLHWISSANIDTPLTTPVAGFTVATLPGGFTGQRTFVTDALAPAFGVAVAGGGAVTIPVFFNGAAWIVG